MKWFWFKRKHNKHRWICLECSKPIWWIPHFEHYIYGVRIGWLLFAFGTGLVTNNTMSVVKANLERGE